MVYLGNGVVWNPSRNERLCKFENGKFETKDINIIDIMNSLGYEGFDTEEKAEENEAVKAVKNSRKKR
jgi:hypothetical protein